MLGKPFLFALGADDGRSALEFAVLHYAAARTINLEADFPEQSLLARARALASESCRAERRCFIAPLYVSRDLRENTRVCFARRKTRVLSFSSDVAIFHAAESGEEYACKDCILWREVAVVVHL